MTDPLAAATDPPIKPPYAPGWLHVLVTWIDRLPGPTWTAYLAILVSATLAMHLARWSQGTSPVGSFDVVTTYWGFLTAATVWVAAYLERTAAKAFDAFRPALTTSETESERLRYELIVVPAGPSIVITVLAAILNAAQFVFVPEAAGNQGLPGPALAVVFVISWFNTAILFQLLYRLVRQMRLVRRTLEKSVVVDLFLPGPLNAFALLTSRPGAVLTLLVASSAVIVPLPTEPDAVLVGWAPYLIVPPIIAVIAFLIPLTGVHERLVAQKEHLQGEAEERLRGVLAGLNREVDAGDLGRADQLNKTLASLLLQRDFLAKLPTWPWSVATLRSFVSAILLPIALFLAQQVLGRLF